MADVKKAAKYLANDDDALQQQNWPNLAQQNVAPISELFTRKKQKKFHG